MSELCIECGSDSDPFPDRLPKFGNPQKKLSDFGTMRITSDLLLGASNEEVNIKIKIYEASKTRKTF